MRSHLPVTCSKLLLLGLVAALAPWPPLAAQAPARARFGVQASFAMPSSMSLGDGAEDVDIEKMDVASNGYGLSAFCQWDFSKKHAFRLRAEYLDFGDKNQFKNHEAALDSRAKSLGFFGEFVYSSHTHDNGGYIFAGAGWINSKVELTETSYQDPEPGDPDAPAGAHSETVSSSASSFGVAAGLGYNWTKNIGMEAKYTRALGLEHQFRSEDPKLDAKWDWVTLSLTIRF